MMQRRMNWFVFLCCIVFIERSDSGLISQSSIQSCDWGDSNEPTSDDGGSCKDKFVVSMTLKSGQGEVEALYANVNQVYTSADSGPSPLKKPFRIEIQKSQTITNYRVYYRGSVNGLPHEHTRIFSRAMHCRDGWYEDHLSCNKQRSLDGSGEFAWDSQGFCCKCTSYIREIRRSKGVCIGGIKEFFQYKGATGFTTYFDGEKRSFGSSAHCMRMHDLWYDVYDIELPMMLYNISIRLLQYEGKVVDVEKGTEWANWTTISTFYLSPSKTMGRSVDGRVVVELQGDLVGANGPLDFSVKKLLIPSLKVWKLDENPEPPVAYTNGPGDWLLVDDHLVDLSGRQCNKVGVSYTGFKRQNSPCDKPEHSCFTNQPLQLWKHDDELRKLGKPGKYMVHNFGLVHPSTHATNHSFILRFIHTDFHNSFVTFRIDASDIVFVYNAAKGRIVDAYAEKFTAVKEVGNLYVEVENTGQLEAEYSVVLAECLGRQTTPSKVVGILPGCIANISFSLQSYKTKGESSVCEVQLFDKSFNLLGTAKVDVDVKGACFCFGECGCSCGSETGAVGNSTALPCPTPPPVVIEKSNLALDIFFLVLESIGIHGIVGFLGGILLVLGCIKLLCGGILCCRKTKAQEHYDNLIKKGVDPKSPLLVKCTGECRGAKAALSRYKRKVERLKKIGKDPGLLDDWRNTSYVCGCRDELADIRFAYVIKALCFYYYCLCLPFVWLGKKIWWAVFKDTAAKKEAAQKAVLNAAKKKGKLEKYGIIDIAAELKNVETEREKLRGEPEKNVQQQSASGGDQKTEQDSTFTGGKRSNFNDDAEKSKPNAENKLKPKKDKKKQSIENDALSGVKAKSAASDGSMNRQKEKGRQENDTLNEPKAKPAASGDGSNIKQKVKGREDKQKLENDTLKKPDGTNKQKVTGRQEKQKIENDTLPGIKESNAKSGTSNEQEVKGRQEKQKLEDDTALPGINAKSASIGDGSNEQEVKGRWEKQKLENDTLPGTNAKSAAVGDGSNKQEVKGRQEKKKLDTLKKPKAKSSTSGEGSSKQKVKGTQDKEQFPFNDVERELNEMEKGMRSKKLKREREQVKLERPSKGDTMDIGMRSEKLKREREQLKSERPSKGDTMEVGMGLNKQKPGMEDKRPTMGRRVEGEMRSSKQKYARRDPGSKRQGYGRTSRVPAAGRPMKTKALKSGGGERPSKSKYAAHGSKQKGSSAAGKDSFSPSVSKTSHDVEGKTSNRQLADTHSEDFMNKKESDCGEKQSSHASLTTSNKPDSQEAECSSSVKSTSSQHLNHKNSSNGEGSVAKVKSDSGSKNSDHQSNASLASSPTHKQHSGVVHSTASHHSAVDKSMSSHHSVAKSLSFQHSAAEEFISSQHSGVASPHHHSDAEMPFSSQTGGIHSNSSHLQSRDSEIGVKSTSHQSSQSGDHSNQSAVHSVSRELVTAHSTSSHHSHHSNDQPSAHSLHQFGSHDGKTSSGSSSAMEKQSSQNVTTTSSSASNSHRDGSLGGTSSSSDSHHTTDSSSTNKKSSSTTSSAASSSSSSSSLEKTGDDTSSSNSSSNEQNGGSDSSRTCDSHKMIASEIQSPGGSYIISGSVSSRHSSESCHDVDSTDDTELLNKSSSSLHSLVQEINSEISSLLEYSEEEVDTESSYSSSNERSEHSSSQSEHTSSSQESSHEESDHETSSHSHHSSSVCSTGSSAESESHSSSSSESESTSHHTSSSPSSS